MIRDLKPYPVYRESGLPWLRAIPEEWEVRRNGRLFAQRNETGREELPILEVSLRTGVRVRTFATSDRKQVMADPKKYKRAAKGDLAYNMMRMWQGALGVSPVNGLVSPAYVVARPFDDVEARYYAYLFRTEAYLNEVDKFSRGIVKDRNRLYWDDFKRIPSPYPPKDEQATIVHFLDHADQRIRRAIRAKRKLIALLNEQKQVIIHQAVARGLDPNVRLKPSGVEWLGDVPEHWEVLLNQRIFKEEVRSHEGRPETQLSLSQRSGLIATSEMQERSLQTSTFDNWKVTIPGDLVANRFKAHLGVFFASDIRGIVSFHYGVFAPRQPLVTKYFELLYHTVPYKTIYAGRSNGMTVGLQNLSNQNFYNVKSIFPPINEQLEIVEYVESATVSLQHTIRTAEREISLLLELRTRLISDVVIGKLDVREAAAQLPPEDVTAEPADDAEAILEDEEFPEDADAEEVEE